MSEATTAMPPNCSRKGHPMSDALTPERRATLRSRAEAMLGGEYNRVVYVPAQTLLTLLDAADEVAKLREEVKRLTEENADLDRDLSDHDALFNRNCALNEENETLRALLAKYQWADSDLRGRPQCPSCCGVAEDEGHYSDCEIAAAIRGTPKESAK